MIMYSYDANAILGEPMKSRIENELLRVFTLLNNYLVERGFKPRWHRLDNECPQTLKVRKIRLMKAFCQLIMQIFNPINNVQQI